MPTDGQQDVREAGHLVERLMLGGVDVYRADASFNSGGELYAAGTYVIPMTQVFARYAKDLLEKQTYPEARRDPQKPNIELPYDVTAWSLGMLLGVDVDFVTTPLPTVRMTRVNNVSRRPPRLGQRHALRSSIHGTGYCDCHQSAAEGRGSSGVRGNRPRCRSTA